MTGFTKNSEKLQFTTILFAMRRQLWHVFPLLMGSLALAGCIQFAPRPPIPVSPVPTTTIQQGPASLYPWTDENATLSGVCFEAALDTAGDVFVLRNAKEHTRFYELADNSQLCRRPVARYPFDFTGGRVLAGLWSYGAGCTARHDVVSVERDDAAKTIMIRLQFVTDGECNYELLRPFWIGLDRALDYQIDIQVADTES
jgi:hypothetical protein